MFFSRPLLLARGQRPCQEQRLPLAAAVLTLADAAHHLKCHRLARLQRPGNALNVAG
jgi:hypothetical protein